MGSALDILYFRLTNHYLTANSSAVFEMPCPASKQVVFQGSVPKVLVAGDFYDIQK
jgi:hypothetical protein